MSSLDPSDPLQRGGALRQSARPKTLGFVLSLVILAIYCGFVLLVAYDKPLLGSEIVPGLSWGILLGALVIVVAWLLTLIYVTASNKNIANR